jgi:hypothetical protein
VIGLRRADARPRLTERAGGEPTAVDPDPEEHGTEWVALLQRANGPCDLLAADGGRGIGPWGRRARRLRPGRGHDDGERRHDGEEPSAPRTPDTRCHSPRPSPLEVPAAPHSARPRGRIPPSSGLSSAQA